MHAECMQPQTLNESRNRTRGSKERIRGEGRGRHVWYGLRTVFSELLFLALEPYLQTPALELAA